MYEDEGSVLVGKWPTIRHHNHPQFHSRLTVIPIIRIDGSLGMGMMIIAVSSSFPFAASDTFCWPRIKNQ